MMQQPVTFTTTLRATWGALTALLNTVPAATGIIATNIDSLQRLSNAGNLKCISIEDDAEYERKIHLVNLAKRLAEVEK